MADRQATWIKEEGLGIITINNPPVNALGRRTYAEILQCVQEMEKDDEVRVLIITGFGTRAFAAGSDIKEMPSAEKTETNEDRVSSTHNTFNSLDWFSKPTIAAINGFALGGGCELTLACDIRIASEKAFMGLPEIKLGIFSAGGGTQRLPRLIGESRAKELLYTGNFIYAEEALRIGMVNRVVPQEEVMEAAKALGKEIASRPGVALNAIKQCVDRGLQMTLEEGLRVEVDQFARVSLSEDSKEGIAAFIEKRPPSFKHR
ncbi:MAG: enoyl-CoA hydratase/isomerase family protein [Bacillota bacterium]